MTHKNIQAAQIKFGQAFSAHQKNDFLTAEKLYIQALRLNNRHSDANHLLGVLYLQTKRPEKAISVIKTALEINEKNPEAYSNLGNAYFHTQNVQQALSCYDKALTYNPALIDAAFNAGVAAFSLKNFTKALHYLDTTLKIKNTHPMAWFYRGLTFKNMGNLAQALECYDKTVALQPQNLQAHINKANILKNLGRTSDAFKALEETKDLGIKSADFFLTKGNILHDLMQKKEAIDCYDQAIFLKNNYAEAYNNKANVLQSLGQNEEAIAAYNKAISFKKNYAEAYNNLANIFLNQKDFERAAINYDHALKINPDYRFAEGALFYSRLFLCDWKNFSTSLENIVGKVRKEQACATPLTLAVSWDNPQDQLACSKVYIREKYRPVTSNVACAKYSHPKIRLAYFSADYHNHATSYLIAGLFENHDKSKFEVTAFSFGKNDSSEIRERIHGACDDFIDIQSLSDEQILDIARKKEIDIAVDLKGFTQNERTGAFSQRLAPLQINFLGYPGTMGTSYIDYIIADSVVIPHEQENAYVEKIIRLPHCYQPNDDKREIEDKKISREEYGLPAGSFVFCAFNNVYKITPDIFSIWMNILQKTPDSVLWLIKPHETAAKNLYNEAEKRGIKKERIIFSPFEKPAQHLGRHKLADLFLDTFPCNAHTTASDALWAGLPLVTCQGQSFASRVASSLLTALDMPELITHDLQQYEDKALFYAHNKKSLIELKEKLSHNRIHSPLFNTKLYTSSIESAFIQIHENMLSGGLPKNLSV
jgi:predicted O-linked N-acetylglucosamine transferase (SPINDLY family)